MWRVLIDTSVLFSNQSMAYSMTIKLMNNNNINNSNTFCYNLMRLFNYFQTKRWICFIKVSLFKHISNNPVRIWILSQYERQFLFPWHSYAPFPMTNHMLISPWYSKWPFSVTDNMTLFHWYRNFFFCGIQCDSFPMIGTSSAEWVKEPKHRLGTPRSVASVG